MSQDTVMVILIITRFEAWSAFSKAECQRAAGGDCRHFPSRGCWIFRLFCWKSFSPNKGRTGVEPVNASIWSNANAVWRWSVAPCALSAR